MGRSRLVLLSLAAALAATPAAAQFGPPPLDPNATVVGELVVRAFGGPAWWKVSDADSTVYILATPGQPVGAWDKSLLERRLQGANSLITRPDFKPGLTAIIALPQLRGIMNSIMKGKEDKMEPALPPALRARFAAAREKIGKPATRYGSLTPALAGFALSGDAYAAMPKPPPAPSSGKTEVEVTATQMAAKSKVRVTPSATYGGWALVTAMGDIKKPGLDCLVATLDDLDTAPERIKAEQPGMEESTLKAWAEGDVRPLLEAFRKGGERTGDINLNAESPKGKAYLKIRAPICVREIPTIKKFGDRWLPDETAAVVRALKKPGKTVAVLSASDLLFKGGVLDQLRQQGFTVTAPGGAE